MPPTHENILGVLSLIIYSLVIVISIKYIAVMMRADNDGEGGILALTALLPEAQDRRYQSALVLLGIFGAALLYGDGMMSPAITVLGAVEGLKVVTPLLARIRVPLRRSGAADAQDSGVMRAGALTIDYDRRRATRDGAEIRLTPKEFDLLSLLARNHDRVLTHRTSSKRCGDQVPSSSRSTSGRWSRSSERRSNPIPRHHNA